MFYIYNSDRCENAIYKVLSLIDKKKDSTKTVAIWSYSKWAADEIIARLVEEATKLPFPIVTNGRYILAPEEVIFGFMEDIDVFINNLRDSKRRCSFNIAKSFAQDVLDVL